MYRPASGRKTGKLEGLGRAESTPMSEEEITQIVRQALTAVAPESADQPLDPDLEFRDQLDLDSMDFLNFVLHLAKASGLTIPERDYPQLASLSGCLEYLSARTQEPASR
jgi:acyl carrier protein